MDAIDALLLATVLSVTGTLAVTFAVGWFRATRRVRDLERQLGGGAPDQAVAHLESRLGTLAEQVEQLASGQEFLARLVTDRLQSPRIQESVSRMATPR